MKLVNASGTVVAEYEYDDWGKLLVEESSLPDIGRLNPIRYRSNYYDTHSKLYYLNSRYYDPETGRFISADDISVVFASPTATIDKNLYAYCDNNPVMREDNGGAFWDTALDILSLGMSIAEVVANPSDIGAWVGLIGDAVDLIPFVTGVGEVTKAVTVTVKASDNSGDVVKSARRLLQSNSFCKTEIPKVQRQCNINNMEVGKG